MKHLIEYRVWESEELERLHDLGLVPDFTIIDWLAKLLEGHPDFLIDQIPLGQTAIVVRDWAPTDIVVRVIDRVVDAEGTKEITGIKLWYLDAHGTSTSPYELRPDQVRVGPGELGLAKGIVQILEDYYSRKAVGMQGRVEESAESFDRLLDLGLLDVPAMTPWGITVARLQHEFPELSIKSNVFSRELEITDPERWTPEGNNIGKISLHVEWRPDLGEGASKIVLTLERAGQWQPIRTFSARFKFDTTAHTGFGHEMSAAWVSQQFADLIGGYIRAWLPKYNKEDENF